MFKKVQIFSSTRILLCNPGRRLHARARGGRGVAQLACLRCLEVLERGWQGGGWCSKHAEGMIHGQVIGLATEVFAQQLLEI